METGIDLKTEDRDKQEELIKLYRVKCGDQKEMLYMDNIKIKYCLCEASSVSKCPDCPRKLFAEVPVDKDWLQKEMEKKEELARQAKAKVKSDQEVASMFSKVDSGEVVLEEANVPEEVYVPEEMDGDVFSSPVPLSVFETPSSVTKRLRSAIPSSASSGTSSLSLQSPSPKIHVRFGRKTLNLKVMVAAVHIASKYDISLYSTLLLRYLLT